MTILAQRLRELAMQVNQQLVSVRSRIGGPLDTQAQCLAAAINEVNAKVALSGAGPSLVTLTASEVISGHKVVAADSAGRGALASPFSALALAVVGVSIGAAQAEAPCEVQTAGPLIEPSWTFVPGPVWLGANGSLTQTPPSSGFIVCIGVATGPTQLLIGPRLVAQL